MEPDLFWIRCQLEPTRKTPQRLNESEKNRNYSWTEESFLAFVHICLLIGKVLRASNSNCSNMHSFQVFFRVKMTKFLWYETWTVKQTRLISHEFRNGLVCRFGVTIQGYTSRKFSFCSTWLWGWFWSLIVLHCDSEIQLGNLGMIGTKFSWFLVPAWRCQIVFLFPQQPLELWSCVILHKNQENELHLPMHCNKVFSDLIKILLWIGMSVFGQFAFWWFLGRVGFCLVPYGKGRVFFWSQNIEQILGVCSSFFWFQQGLP